MEQKTKKETKVEEVERLLEENLRILEEGVLVGDYQKTLTALRRAKGIVHIIKVDKLWTRGNKYFAIVDTVKQVKESFRKKNIKELEEGLNQLERLLLSK